MTGDAERRKIEEEFHDRAARVDETTFYDFGALDEPDAYLIATLGDLRGKALLEIGCGIGTNTIAFARAGAFVTALDISSEMVAVARERAAREGLSERVLTIHSSVEEMDFPEGSFDVVYGHSVLHHLELSSAIPRIARALRPGGIASFLDPLDHNPILNGMRKLTPDIRTPTEKPLSTEDIRAIGRSFSSLDRQEFHFLSLAAFVWYYVVRNERFFRATLGVLSKLDRMVFRTMPSLRRFAWVTVLTFKR